MGARSGDTFRAKRLIWHTVALSLGESGMQRITITIDETQLQNLDDTIQRRGYASRSEAIRDVLRDAQAKELAGTDPSAVCYATLSCVFDHETRDLSRRLTELQHHRHDISVASLHVHITQAECLEVVILKGPLIELQAMSDEIMTQRGVRMGHLHIIPMSDAPRAEHEAHHSHQAG